MGWTPDSKSILFDSTRSTAFPGGFEAYSISIDGGQERKLPFREAKELSYSPAGGSVAFGTGREPGIARGIEAPPTTTFGWPIRMARSSAN